MWRPASQRQRRRFTRLPFATSDSKVITIPSSMTRSATPTIRALADVRPMHPALDPLFEIAPTIGCFATTPSEQEKREGG